MIRKLFTFYSFVVTSFLAVSGILSATNYLELATAVLFTPLALYFFILMLPKKAAKVLVDMDDVMDIIPDQIKKIKNPDYDPERRKFLKLIGAAGGSLFLMTVFTRKAEASFFGSMPGPGTLAIKNSSGTTIDPSEKHPTDGYNITEIDDSGLDTYYGYLNKDGAWFIRKELSTGAYRYAKGASDFTNATTGWPNRTSLTYGYFNDIF
ncbi:MAG: twin-arginine translocation signal domain-containing protein [Patescibacteria group bacterium]